jgi:hypothetical protein
MVQRNVSKMGSRMRVVYLPVADYHKGQRVKVKPKGKAYYIVKKVSKMGSHLLVVIPKADWAIFKHRSVVYITTA